jgi:hypothetical protein
LRKRFAWRAWRGADDRWHHVNTSPPSLAQVRASIARLERGRAAAALMRSNPEFTTEAGRLVLQTMDLD